MSDSVGSFRLSAKYRIIGSLTLSVSQSLPLKGPLHYHYRYQYQLIDSKLSLPLPLSIKGWPDITIVIAISLRLFNYRDNHLLIWLSLHPKANASNYKNCPKNAFFGQFMYSNQHHRLAFCIRKVHCPDYRLEYRLNTGLSHLNLYQYHYRSHFKGPSDYHYQNHYRLVFSGLSLPLPLSV